MNNQFEERLRNRITAVFDAYEDDSADRGWNELRKIYPARKERKPSAWWIGSAAAVLMLAFGWWLNMNQTNLVVKKKNEVAVTKEVRRQKPATIEAPGEFATPAPTASSVGSGHGRLLAAVPKVKAGKGTSTGTRKASLFSRNVSGLAGDDSQLANEGTGKYPAGTAAFAATDSTPALSTISTSAANTELASAQVAEPTAALKTKDAAPAEQAETRIPTKASASFMDLAAASSGKTKTTSDIGSKQAAESKKVIFGVYAGSFINYASGSSNKVNVGAGLSSDIALTKRLKLSTGFAFSQSDLSFKGDIPSSVQNTFAAAFSTSAPQAIRAISYSVEKYDARLLGVDIPLNLKYTLSSEQANEWYVAAGVSSGGFLNESYTYHYTSSGLTNYRLPGQEPVSSENKVERGFTDFEFARRLNFAIGIGYPFGKQNRLIIEPFVNYPIKGIGVENLRYGSGGVNLKLNFKTSAK